MQANELRLRNYVLIDNPKSHPNLLNQPVQVVGIQLINDISFQKSNASISVEIDIHNGFSQFNEFIKPIPLTEDWLVKFGFDLLFSSKFRKAYDFSKDLRFGYADNFGLSNTPSAVTFVGNCFSHIKHVHELQNLYFSLTGHELTVAYQRPDTTS